MQMSTQAHRQSGAVPSPEAIDMKRTTLLLDVDGTLIDIAATPTCVVVPEDLRRILRKLLELSDGAVAFVSGRTIESLDTLFAPLTAPQNRRPRGGDKNFPPRSKAAMAPRGR
jgi:trehalose 6-phosphate phosphatase